MLLAGAEIIEGRREAGTDCERDGGLGIRLLCALAGKSISRDMLIVCTGRIELEEALMH